VSSRYVYQEVTETMLERVRRIEVVCDRNKVPLAVIQLSIGDDRITSTICRVSKPARIDWHCEVDGPSMYRASNGPSV